MSQADNVQTAKIANAFKDRIDVQGPMDTGKYRVVLRLDMGTRVLESFDRKLDAVDLKHKLQCSVSRAITADGKGPEQFRRES